MRLKELREDRDLLQVTVAEYLHIRQNTYSQYENGQRQLPLALLIRLSYFYHTSTDYILGLTDEQKPYPPSSRTRPSDYYPVQIPQEFPRKNKKS